ncbi:response regulator [Lewinella sp. IMCC34183]|uniref:response regulator n=1 Tax=Lewinella sp. IMCC34183 TaxID=2248762 RepID=UPI000E2215A3|nr:response regulator [Lewinella sp. IMCC34183]
MRILIVDDSGEKIANIAKIIRNINQEFTIETCQDRVSCLKLLIEQGFDLLILDLQLPKISGLDPEDEGGALIVKEIYRKEIYHLPRYIVAVTQYTGLKYTFSAIWKVIVYQSSNWIDELSTLVSHIHRVQKDIRPSIPVHLPTVFVEGITDQQVLTRAIELFRPDAKSKISIRSQKSAGASWVAKQIIAWAYSLRRDEVGKYTKAIALLDGDSAGNDARAEINRVIQPNSASSTTFKVINLSPQYSITCRTLYQKGLCIPVTLEELYSDKLWQYASEQNWTENKAKLDQFLKDPRDWNKRSQSLEQYIDSLNLSNTEYNLLGSFTDTGKTNAVKTINRGDDTTATDYLSNFETLVNEIVEYLC